MGPRVVGPTVREYERTQLLDRVDRESATVGATIPETLPLTATSEGEEVETLPLQEFVFEVKRLEEVPADRREEVESVKRRLRRERLERRQRLEEGDITRETGERLVEEIIGIQRALEGLQSLGPTDVEAEANREEMADKKRWRQFLKRAMGEDEQRGGR